MLQAPVLAAEVDSAYWLLSAIYYGCHLFSNVPERTVLSHL